MKNISLFYGSSYFSIEQAINKIYSANSSKYNRYNFALDDYKNIDLFAESLHKAAYPGLFSAVNSIKLEKIENIPLKEPITKLLNEIFLNNSLYSSIVLTSSEQSISKLSAAWQKILSGLSGKILLEEFVIPYNQIGKRNWLQAQANLYSLNLTPAQLDRILKNNPFDQYLLHSLFYKLYLCKSKITDDIIDELQIFSIEDSVFAIAENLLRRDFKKSIIELQNLLSQNPQRAVEVQLILASFLKRLFSTAELKNMGYSLGAIQEKLKIPNWLAKKNWELILEYDINDLQKLYSSILVNDLKIKYLGPIGYLILINQCHKFFHRTTHNLDIKRNIMP